MPALFVPNVTLPFQSTHPVRGATQFRLQRVLPPEISIHAPREGCDDSKIAMRNIYRISIHAPREGCDAINTLSADMQTFISIHAPREGCDPPRPEYRDWALISIHAPREGCDAISGRTRRGGVISIHAPREGCDCKNGLHISKYGYSTHSTASIVPYDSPAFSPICESAESICQQITHS